MALALALYTLQSLQQIENWPCVTFQFFLKSTNGQRGLEDRPKSCQQLETILELPLPEKAQKDSNSFPIFILFQRETHEIAVLATSTFTTISWGVSLFSGCTFHPKALA